MTNQVNEFLKNKKHTIITIDLDLGLNNIRRQVSHKSLCIGV